MCFKKKYIYLPYIYIYICVCVCVCVRMYILFTNDLFISNKASQVNLEKTTKDYAIKR